MAGPGPYGSVGVDYRELQAPVGVNTDLPDNGAAEHARALAGLFKEFEGESEDVLNKTELQAGSLAGAASGATGAPQYKQGLARLTAYGNAFNNAATGAYAIEAEAQADDSAARLRVQANNNPETFRATYSAVRDSVLKTAPPEARAMLNELYNKRLALGLAAITNDQLTQQRELQRQTYDQGISRQTSRVAILSGSADPHDQLAAQDEQVKLSLLIDGGVNSGLYSEAEAKSMHVLAQRQITSEVFQTQLDRELANHGDPVGLLERFRKAHEANLNNPNESPILSEDEFNKLMMDGKQKILQENMMEAYTRRDGKSAEELRFAAGDQKYTAALFDGSLTLKQLSDAVRLGDLKPETARSLRSMMELGPSPKTDPKAYARVTNNPEFLNMSPMEIAAQPGISNADKIKLMEEQRKRNASFEGTQAVKDARAALSAALKIPPGTPLAALSDEQKKALVEANLELTQTLNATDPAHRDGAAMSTAQAIIQKMQQRQAADDAIMLQRAKDSFMKRYGPGGSESLDDKSYQQRLQHYDDQIQQAQRTAAGK